MHYGGVIAVRTRPWVLQLLGFLEFRVSPSGAYFTARDIREGIAKGISSRAWAFLRGRLCLRGFQSEGKADMAQPPVNVIVSRPGSVEIR